MPEVRCWCGTSHPFLSGKPSSSLVDQPCLYAVLEQPPGLFGQNRRAEIKPLSLATSVVLKEFELRSSFYALRNHPLLQASAEIDHGADNSRVCRVRSDLLHEGLMQFQGVRRKPPQIGKAGIPRSKVVDSELHAHGFQLNQRDHRSLRVTHQHALG